MAGREGAPDLRAAAPRRRPNGRSARVRAAVLAATVDELAERGYGDLSIEAVAARAGVNKTTIYRRWSGRPALVLDAMLEFSRQTVPVPDTGTLAGDLLELGSSIASNLASPAVLAVLRALVAAGREPAIAEASRRYWRARFDLVAEVVERASARGELMPRAPSDAIVEALIGPLYLRALVTGGVLDAAAVRRCVDLALAAARGHAAGS
jgi:AcrR family transcriptional regulator